MTLSAAAAIAPDNESSPSVSPSAGAVDRKEGKKSSSGDFRVAQVDQGKNTQSVTVGTSSEPGAARREQLTEIVVTAQKREERLMDVPISVVALSAEQLEERNIIGLDDLAMAVPGLSINSQGSYNRRLFLRGVANDTGSSLIGIYLDEADVTSWAYTQLDLRSYDLERVEVLRGPQGTLYGDGSAGGTIRFITKNPQLDHFSMNADVAALFTENGAPGQRIEAMVNVPLIDNVLGVASQVPLITRADGSISPRPAKRTLMAKI